MSRLDFLLLVKRIFYARLVQPRITTDYKLGLWWISSAVGSGVWSGGREAGSRAAGLEAMMVAVLSAIISCWASNGPCISLRNVSNICLNSSIYYFS